eukprot:246868-Prorocentrum_minimum.AAC.1
MRKETARRTSAPPAKDTTTARKGVSTWPCITCGVTPGSVSQSQGGREPILDVGAYHRGEESIFLMGEPITGGKRAYS